MTRRRRSEPGLALFPLAALLSATCSGGQQGQPDAATDTGQADPSRPGDPAPPDVDGGAGAADAGAGVGEPGALTFQHVVIDDDPPEDKHAKTIGDIDGDGLIDVIASGAGRGGAGLVWYRYPDWSRHRIVPPGTGFTTDMQVGDVDGDGDLDVVVPKGISTGESVWWYENPRPDGDPTTDHWTEHEIGDAAAHDLEVGDVDGDGRLDVVVRGGNTVLFLQVGRDTWTRVGVSARPSEGVALGDLDRDGDLDIVINSYWLENPLPEGDVTAEPWPEHGVAPDWPERVGAEVADLNGDDRLDIAYSASESPGRLVWYAAPEDPVDGAWTEHVVDPSVDYVHTFESADVDLDGDVDLVTAEMEKSDDPDEVSVYLNPDEGREWTKLVVATTGSHNIRVGDVGGDGDLDIVGANWKGAAPLEMWRNDMFADWTRHVIDHEKPWRSVFVRAGDLDGDGRVDLATGGWWYRNPGSAGGSWTRQTIGEPLRNVAVLHDFDGDGDLDVLGTQGGRTLSNSRLAWARNDGSGAFTVHTNVQAARGDFLQGADVLPGEGGAPPRVVLSWHDAGAGLQALDVPGSPSDERWSWSVLSPASSGEDLTAADLDDDGDRDLVLGRRWLRNDGESWSEHTLAADFPTPDRHELVDLSGDGRLDVVLGEESVGSPGRVAWLEQPSAATEPWTEHPIAGDIVGGGMSLDVGDVDLDGDDDVVVGEHDPGATDDSTRRLLLLDNADGAAGRWTERVIYEGDEHHDGTRLVDVDDDGDLDIASIGWSHDRVLLYENPTR